MTGFESVDISRSFSRLQAAPEPLNWRSLSTRSYETPKLTLSTRRNLGPETKFPERIRITI